MDLSIFDIIAILLVASAVFGYINFRFIRLPHTIGIVIVALLASALVIITDLFMPELGINKNITGFLRSIDFHETLMKGMLSALLFAGAIHVDLSYLAERKWAIGIMATIGVIVSTCIVGTAMWLTLDILGLRIPYIWALVFGALISPTDPVAVLGVLKTVRVPKTLEAKIAGESLFNDGVGVVIFTIIVAFATSTGVDSGGLGVSEITKLFVMEAFGGAILGIIGGFICYWFMRSINEHNIEVLITLALVFGIYSLAIHWHLSGPIAVVIAGLFIGNHGAMFAMSENTRRHVFQFWELIDEILNSILFLLIGLEVLLLTFTANYLLVGVFAIFITLLSRWIAVAIPISLLATRERFTKGAITILTWGGLRGGISVALALSLPDNEFKMPILVATYSVVVFSIIIQGLTMRPLLKFYIKDD